MSFVWSITKWRDYETCPLMAYNKHVLKNFEDRPSPALDRGRKVHKAFEESVKHNIALPTELAAWDDALEPFDGRRDVFTEYKFGLNRALLRTGFFDNDVWIRFVLDVFVPATQNPLAIDYKTGRYKDNHRSDAEFYGAAVSVAYTFPRVPVQYWYIDNPSSSFEKVVDLPEAQNIMSRWRQLFEAAELKLLGEYLPEAEKGMGCKYCQVKTCQHYQGA